MNYNIRRLIIDKIARNRWQYNMNKMNNIIHKIHFTPLMQYIDSAYLFQGCLNCGYIKDHKRQYRFTYVKNKPLRRMVYGICEKCNKKKYIIGKINIKT